MANIIEIRGNIFESSCQTVVNTVNCVGVMGKGIAFEYKNRFPDMYLSYMNVCQEKKLHPGLLFLWKKSTPWVLNFPTKNHWKYPSKIEYIEKGLKKFAETYMDRGISSIAFPQLGTHSGGLDWQQVSPLMYHYLEPLSNLDIEIYHFDPNATDSLFDKFHQKVHRFNLDDYVNFIGLQKKQAKILKDAMDEKVMHTMLELQDVGGLGEKTFELIYSFLAKKENRLVTVSELQPSLDF